MARAATLRREDSATARVARQNGFAQAGYPRGASAQPWQEAPDAAAQGGASFEDAGSLAEVPRAEQLPKQLPQAGMSRQPPCCRGWLLDLPDLW